MEPPDRSNRQTLAHFTKNESLFHAARRLNLRNLSMLVRKTRVPTASFSSFLQISNSISNSIEAVTDNHLDAKRNSVDADQELLFVTDEPVSNNLKRISNSGIFIIFL